ncbi:MAG: phosphocholine cytidylyltransferase family protein [Nitrososphaeria archaeon]|nr:phosphocholine cytidylyltransferase family protein [Nitrososphaeria archaeon]
MKAIILAAGEGKRLRPLTDNIPKCMVNLFGVSLLQRQVDIFRKSGIDDISVITGYRSDKINIQSVRYFHNDKYDTTNMVETLFCAKEVMSGSVIVSYGDIVFQKNVWYEYWKTRFPNPLDDAESLLIDESGYIADIGQKVKNIDSIMGQYIGLMKFQGDGLEFLKKHYEDLRRIAQGGKNPLNPNLPFEKSYMTDLLNDLIAEKCRLKAIPINNGWLELDTISDFTLYEKLHNENSLKFYSPDA